VGRHREHLDPARGNFDMTVGLPDDLVQQFRGLALQRLERIATAWASVVTNLDDEAATLLHREIHTLKGESRMVGFTEVNLVSDKIEDLLDVARSRGYAVDEDFDLAVNMALRFTAMLVHKKVGAQLHGVDLPSFVKRIDTVIATAKPEPRSLRFTTGSFVALRRDPSSPRVPGALRPRLAALAVDAFIEYASARGARRDRLRVSWHSLRDLIGIHRAAIGAGQLAKHRSNALQLARDLGKELDVTFDIVGTEVTAETLAALDAAVLHLVRNAVDHGIELPATRIAVGKPAAGAIRLHCGLRGDRLVLTVEDDGRGVAIDEVMARAIDLGLVPPNAADRERWLEFVCQPGFTTRAQASDVSGRGVGLDVVRAATSDVGGTLAATTRDGIGTRWTVEVPVPKLSFVGHVLGVDGVAFPIMIDDSWTPTAVPPGAPAIDLAERLGLVETPSTTPPVAFTNGTRTVAIRCGEPAPIHARRLVAVPAPSIAEVVAIDAAEGLLVHPDRLR
jgi:two-component system chemotaxis sensor kinase CheA